MEQLFTNYNYIPVKKKRNDERAEIISELYDIYLQDKTSRKISNWKRYVAWCKEYKKPKGSEKEFKKSKRFLKEVSIKSFCFFLSHVPKNDLFYVLSVAKDKVQRKENVSGYLLSHFNVKS